MNNLTIIKQKIKDGPFLPVCEGIQINLAGLTDKPNFRLIKLLNTIVEVKLKCDGKQQVKVGKLVKVATDFIEIEINKSIVLLLQEDIESVNPA